MDFFAQQDKARRHSGRLVMLFCFAVLALIVITNLLVALTLWFMTQNETMQAGMSVMTQTDSHTLKALFSWQNFILISLGVVGAVLCAVLYKWAQLSSGGKAVAEALGGIRIYPNTDDADEKKILNVVEEMALAAGMPVPAVYLLPQEGSINAFAAGKSPADAVVGITRGAIQVLKRDELQGVIAHEFSHILNGDMRLNIRLIALLHGIVFIGIVGEVLMRSRSGDRNDNRLALLGLALLLIGWLGSFFGNLIKSAVSRQREYLADASAVQFTRNPNGIGNALKLIGGHSGGTEIDDPHRSEVSHLFFGQAFSMSGMMATHPPLVDRILRVDPDWDGNYLYRSISQEQAEPETEVVEEKERKREVFTNTVLAGAAVTAGVMPEEPFEAEYTDSCVQSIEGIPEYLYFQSKEPFGAMAICLAMVVAAEEGEIQTRQLASLKESGIQGLRDEVEKIRALLPQLAPLSRLPLIELLLPSLKCLSASQYKSFSRALMILIRADQKTDLFEWCLFQLVRHYMMAEMVPKQLPKPKFEQPQQVGEACQIVFSHLAAYGHQQADEATAAFNRAAGAMALYNIEQLDVDSSDLDGFVTAIAELAACQPLLKGRVMNALKKCVLQDGQVTAEEQELLAAIAVVIDAPMPRLIEN